MSTQLLAGRQFLVVEDEYLIASDILMTLEEAGARVFGPISDVERAVEVLADPGFKLDAAILDIDLGGQMVFPAAELLIKHKTPFVFISGLEDLSMPEAFAATPRLSKPYRTADLISLLQSVGPQSEANGL